MTDKCYRVCIDAANAHTNLNTWGAVIAKDEQAKFLRIYDAALEDAGDEP
jgi:hypothetical protein